MATKDELKAIIETIVDQKIKDTGQPRSEIRDFISNIVSAQYQEGNHTKVKGQGFARMLRALAASRGDPAQAAEFAKKHWKDEAVVKSLTTNVLTAGGAFVPEEFSSEVVELLRARSVVRRAMPRIQPMESGVLSIPRLTAGATAEWVGEATAQNASQPSTDMLRLVWKKLRATVPISNELLAYSDPNVDEIVRDDAIEALSTKQDIAFLRSLGTEHSPKGLRYWASSGNVNATAGATLANVDTDILELINGLDGASVSNVRRVIFMSTREFNKLRTLRTSNDVPAFPTVVADGTLFGMPIFASNNIPINLGAGSDESEVYVVEMNDVIIGQASTLEVVVSNEASYTNSAGTLVSSFDRDETVMKVIQRLDLVVRHPEAVAVQTGIKWGA